MSQDAPSNWRRVRPERDCGSSPSSTTIQSRIWPTKCTGPCSSFPKTASTIRLACTRTLTRLRNLLLLPVRGRHARCKSCWGESDGREVCCKACASIRVTKSLCWSMSRSAQDFCTRFSWARDRRLFRDSLTFLFLRGFLPVVRGCTLDLCGKSSLLFF